MSFSTQDSEIVYDGDGVDSTFEIPYDFQNPSQIKVQKYDLTDPEEPVTIDLDENTDYTLVDTTITLVVPDMDGMGDPILVPVPLETYEKLRIYRDTNDSRPANYSTYQFPYPSVNNEMDRVHHRLQELRREVDRAIKLNALSLENGETLTGEDILAAIQELEDLIENLDSGGGLPSGGNPGDFLERIDETTAEWMNGTYQGFSAKHNQEVDLQGLKATLDFLVGIAYAAPLVSLSASGSGTLREKGTAVTSSTLTASVTKRSDPIAKIRFLLNGSELVNYEPPGNTGSGNTVYNWTGSFSDNATFRVEVTDSGATGGPTVVGANAGFSFVYPFFWGAAAPNAALSALGKQVITNSNNRNVSYTAVATQVFYYAYPASYGDLTSIKDENGFEVIGSWTKKSTTYTGLDSASVPYTVYEYSIPLGVGVTTNYTFIR